MADTRLDSGIGRRRLVVAISGGVYLIWWFAVEALLPGSFNPLPGRLAVVGLSALLFGASFWSRRVERALPILFTGWVCVLVAHYGYLLLGNHGDPTWWVGAFVTFAAASMCLQTGGQVAVFSFVALGCVIAVATIEGQLGHTIYVPGLATILLLAYVTKRSQTIAHDATLQAERSDEQRLQLAAIVESSGDAIIASSLDGLIQSWNKGAERLFGYGEAEVIGQPIALLLPPGQDAIEPALIAQLRDLRERVPRDSRGLAGGEAGAPFEAVRRRKDGGDLDVSVTISPIRDSRGELVGASLAARDISVRKRAEAELQRARDAAEAANQDLEAFNYSVAHDLRTPLRGIDGFSHLLLEEYSHAIDPAGQEYLQRVRKAAQQMGRLIDGLLSFGRITRVDMHGERVDLSKLAREITGQLAESQPDRVVEVVIQDGLSETGDSTLLAAALENLLGNAWKFTRDQPHARVELGSTDEGGATTYFVRDNGAGFDMAFAAKLFGVFQRLHQTTEYEGTGVGLATVKRIVSRHGGRVWAEGKVGEGACFYFTIGEPSEL